MHTLKDKPAMHAMMKEKGFRLKSDAEIEQLKNERRAEQKAEEADRQKKMEEARARQKARREGSTENGENRLDSLSLRHKYLADMHDKLEAKGSTEVLYRRMEKERLVAMAAPRDSTTFLVSLACVAAMVGITIMGIVSRRGKKQRGGLRR